MYIDTEDEDAEDELSFSLAGSDIPVGLSIPDSGIARVTWDLVTLVSSADVYFVVSDGKAETIKRINIKMCSCWVRYYFAECTLTMHLCYKYLMCLVLYHLVKSVDEYNARHPSLEVK